MSHGLGHNLWVIAEGYIPEGRTGSDPALVSHDTACILNTGSVDANVTITVYFANRDPAEPYSVLIPARRTKHLRFNELTDPEPIPRGTDYSSVLRSDVPVVVQHSRLDTRQPSNALLSTMAFPVTGE
jgi:hypothetical protein